jgi:hypothetical protein
MVLLRPFFGDKSFQSTPDEGWITFGASTGELEKEVSACHGSNLPHIRSEVTVLRSRSWWSGLHFHRI